MLLWTPTICQKSILATISCCIEQGESLSISLWILSRTGAEFLVALSSQLNSSFEKGLLSFSLLVWFACTVFCSSFCLNYKKVESEFCGKDSSASLSHNLLAMLLLTLYFAPLTSRVFNLFESLPFKSLTLAQPYYIGALLLRQLASFSQSSFLFVLARLLNSAIASSTG